MKKYLLLLFVLFPLSIFSVEGTCAWHGGVDCSVGPDWDGSAICMDGWTESNERYFEQNICKDTPMCTQYLWNQMSNTMEMNENKTKYKELVNLINILNLEYPLIEIKINEEYKGRGITKGGIAPIIDGAKRINRNTVATSTYEATIIDSKLRKFQLEINKICIDEGIRIKQAVIDSYKSPIVITKQNNLDLKSSPYQNIRDKKIYKDVRQNYAMNTELGCDKLGLFGEDLAMCEAFSSDKNKDSWLSIDRPETKIVTTKSLLEEQKIKEDLLKKEQELLKKQSEISIKKELSKQVKNNIDSKSKDQTISTSTEDKNISIPSNISTSTPLMEDLSNSTTSIEIKKDLDAPKTTIVKRITLWFKNLFR